MAVDQGILSEERVAYSGRIDRVALRKASSGHAGGLPSGKSSPHHTNRSSGLTITIRGPASGEEIRCVGTHQTPQRDVEGSAVGR